jgi:FAD/FMN-containing dehydrogenase
MQDTELAYVPMTEIIAKLEQIVGATNVLTGDERLTRKSAWETHQPCNALAIVRPSSTDEVVKVMRLCHELGQTVVPYGGLTNLVQGCVTTDRDIALSFERMNQIEEVDRTGLTMVAGAGVTLQQAQERAEEEGLFFPVDIGARGTCMVGGNVSTNAGGTKVIRHGMMRDSVLGMEVVLADGTVLDSMNRFLKNNSGFDLKQLFIGTEGVLGLITKVVFRLEVTSKSHNVALLACSDYSSVLAVLRNVQDDLGANLCGFEVMWSEFIKNVVKPVGNLTAPIATEYPFYIIVESMGTQVGTDDQAFETCLESLMDQELVVDGTIAKSGQESDAIWSIRHEVEWLVRNAFNFDVSLPIASVNEYVGNITKRICADVVDAEVAAFGHLGDNNIHISVLSEDHSEENTHRIQKHIYEGLVPYRGAISAEHGIGLEKREWLPISRTGAEIELMKTLKRSLDPCNILNPGKVIALD